MLGLRAVPQTPPRLSRLRAGWGRLPAGEIHCPSRPGQGQMKHLSPAQAAIRWWAPSDPRDCPRSTRGGHPTRLEPPTTRRARNRTLTGPPLPFLPTAGLVLTAPAVLKATEPYFPVADFCPEPWRCRLRAGSLTPRAGRQRATAASTVPVASEAWRFRKGLGASTSTWVALELTLGMPAAVRSLGRSQRRQKGA